MPSQFPHGYESDIFISYSSRDLDWVQTFHDALLRDVTRFAPDVSLFFDKSRLEVGSLWDEQLLSAARESAILLPVLSPGYFESDYCQRELRAFVDAHGLMSATLHRSRIMPVKLLCAAPVDHLLANVQAETFYKQGSNGIPFEHSSRSSAYKEALRRLAHAMAQLLRTLPSKARRPAVYLASDFTPAAKKLRKSLAHYYDVLPNSPDDLLGLSTDRLQETLEQDFARCFVSVHALGDAPLARALIDRQLAHARRVNKPRLVWSADRPDDLTNAGFEWFTSQAEIEDRIRRLFEKPLDPKSSSTTRDIYFLCPDRANKERAEPLLEALERRGLHVYPSPLEGPADLAVKTHISMLEELDGCLIYYGDVDRAWFDAVFLRVRKKIRQRELPSAIFLAPPPTDHKTRDLRNLGLPLVDEPDAAARAFLGAAR
jgi:hypothetical protein